jgi:hypothetical protein
VFLSKNLFRVSISNFPDFKNFFFSFKVFSPTALKQISFWYARPIYNLVVRGLSPLLLLPEGEKVIPLPLGDCVVI